MVIFLLIATTKRTNFQIWKSTEERELERERETGKKRKKHQRKENSSKNTGHNTLNGEWGKTSRLAKTERNLRKKEKTPEK